MVQVRVSFPDTSEVTYVIGACHLHTLTYHGVPGYLQCVSMISTILPPPAVMTAVRRLNKPKLLVN